LEFNPFAVATLLTAFGVFAPFAILAAYSNPKRYILAWFREMVSHSPSFFTGGWSILSLLVYWASLPIFLMMGWGLFLAFRDRERQIRLMAAGALLSLPFFLLRPVPRYWAQLTAMMAFFAAYGIVQIITTRRIAGIGVTFLVIVVLVNQGAVSFRSSRAAWFQETVSFLSTLPHLPSQSAWLFSNFWPHKFLRFCSCAQHASWLTTDQEDARIFAVSGVLIRAVDIPPPALPLEILEHHGGIVIILVKPAQYANPDPPYRASAVTVVRALYEPVWVWNARSPLLPLTLIPERVEVYRVMGPP
jgi:hypothetical protein